jgi:hypothetical protein
MQQIRCLFDLSDNYYHNIATNHSREYFVDVSQYTLSNQNILKTLN